MEYRVHRRAIVAVSALALLVVGVVAGPSSVLGHGNTCASGNSDYVVIVYINSNQTGTADDLCWIGTHSFDDQVSQDDANVDDIGENANFHDAITSMALKNFGSNGLCVKWYQDAFQSVWRESHWIGAGQGDIHYNAAYNDNYDSVDISWVSQATCIN